MQITLGEAVSNGFYYSAFVPNLSIPQIFQPFLDYLWGFRTFDTARGPGFPSPVPRALLPFPLQRDSGVPRLHVGRTDRGDTVIPRIPRNRLSAVTAVILAGLLVVGAAVLVHHVFFGPKTITAYFTTATAIYPGDEVRVSGVKVGTIESIQARGHRAKMTMHVDHDVPIPADAKAVIVAQNLVARPLRPAHAGLPGTADPKMADGAVIPVERTAVPVEWDEVKTQLMRLATDLGPNSKRVDARRSAGSSTVPPTRWNGNGEKLRQTLAQLSGVGRILADGSGNIVDIIKNLQTFVTALRDSNVQIVQFNDRLATLTSVVNDSRSDLDAALTNLSTAVGEVQRFIAGNPRPDQRADQRLANVTQTWSTSTWRWRNVLHVAPNAFANFYNIYNPDTGTIVGGIGFTTFANSTSSGAILPLPVPGCSIGSRRERHVGRNGQAVRPVSRPRVAGAQLQRAADPDQPLPDAVGEPSKHHLRRAAPGARR